MTAAPWATSTLAGGQVHHGSGGGGRGSGRSGGSRSGGGGGSRGKGFVLVEQHGLAGLYLDLVGTAVEGNFIFHLT